MYCDHTWLDPDVPSNMTDFFLSSYRCKHHLWHCGTVEQ
jgi:hypothetical protein